MKLIGAVLLAVGVGVGVYAFTMSIGVEVPSQAIGFGITTPAMTIADPSLVAQRQNYLILSAVLAVVGALILGMGLMGKKR